MNRSRGDRGPDTGSDRSREEGAELPPEEAAPEGPREGEGARWVIREVRAGDLGRVAEVEARCFTTPWSPRAFRSLLGKEHVTFRVAEAETPGSGAQVVGHGVLWRIGPEAELANLAVAPEAQGRGIAGALLDHLLDEAERDGVRTVFLEVRASNAAALALYQGRGFRQVGLRSHYYDRPREDARVLRLELHERVPHPPSTEVP